MPSEQKADPRLRYLVLAVSTLFVFQIVELVAGRFGLSGHRLAARVINLEQQVKLLEGEVQRLQNRQE